MKNVCKALALICLIIGGVMLFASTSSPEMIISGSSFIGSAIMLWVAAVIIDRLDKIMASSAILSNPKKSVALDFSLAFVINAMNPKCNANMIDGTGSIQANLNGGYTVRNVEFEAYDNGLKEYRYSCEMIYIGGDIYQSNSWRCDYINVYDKEKFKPIFSSEENK